MPSRSICALGDSILALFNYDDGAKLRKLTYGLRRNFLKCPAQQGDVVG
jgi:hypothetical protein